MKLRILSYDISNNKSRRRVAKALEASASRVQYSVFESRLNARQLKELISILEPHLAKGDSLRVYTVGKTGERHCKVYGSGVPIDTNANYWLL